MSIFGHVLAGAAQGLGQGMYQDAIAKREAALASLRMQHETQRDEAARAARATERKEDRQYKVEDQKTDYRNKLGILAFGGTIDADKQDRSHQNRMAEIKTTAVNTRELETLRSRLRTSESAADIRLRDSLDSGDIRSVEMGEDGQLYGVTDRGLVPTGVMGAPKTSGSGASADNGGGRLTEGEQESAFKDAEKKWRDGGREGDPPKRSDFIGMTRDAYTARRGRPVRIQLPREAAPSGQAAATGRMSPVDTAVSQLRNDYQTATPEEWPEFFRNGRKVPLAELERTVREGLK